MKQRPSSEEEAERLLEERAEEEKAAGKEVDGVKERIQSRKRK